MAFVKHLATAHYLQPYLEQALPCSSYPADWRSQAPLPNPLLIYKSASSWTYALRSAKILNQILVSIWRLVKLLSKPAVKVYSKKMSVPDLGPHTLSPP